MAKELSITVSTLSHWECDYQEPSFKDLLSLSKYFNVTTDYLLGVEDDFGVRTVEAVPEQFTQEERGIIDDYRQLNFYGKKLVKQTLDTLLLKDSSTEAKKNNN
jgi:transcriptional regulator with XRE-family HTH domain